MQLYTHTLPSGAKLTGYLRDETNEMPAFNIRPAMLILPGGGYAFCSAREADPIAMQFLQAGYQTFVMEYTCAHTPEQAPLRWQPLIDAAGAILHLRRNAAKLRLDPFKIAVCGFSAGGHLAASTAILWDAAPVQKALGITAEEARPDAVVLGYPVITVGHQDPQRVHRQPGRGRYRPAGDLQPGKPGARRSAAVLHLAHRGRPGCAGGKLAAAGQRPDRKPRALRAAPFHPRRAWLQHLHAGGQHPQPPQRRLGVFVHRLAG